MFRLRYRQHDFELRRGPFVIGRSGDCHLALDSGLVSRRHAVLNVLPRGVVIEDLGSRNGVYVNGVLVENSRTLAPGDQIRIGDDELTLIAGGGPDCTTVDQNADLGGVGAMALLTDLADKAMAMGRADEAERLLSIHLLHIMESALAGIPIDGEIADRASLYAARLATVTRLGRWFDYPLRLGALLSRPCSQDVVNELYAAAGRVEGAEPEVLRGYIQALGRDRASLGPADKFLLKRLQGLERVLEVR